MIKHITAAAILAMALAGTSSTAMAQTAEAQPARATAVGVNIKVRPTGSAAIGRDLVVVHIAPWDSTQKVSPVIHDDHSVRPSCPPVGTAIDHQCTVTAVGIAPPSGVIKGSVVAGSVTIGGQPW